jgi:hypothetical protein
MDSEITFSLPNRTIPCGSINVPEIAKAFKEQAKVNDVVYSDMSGCQGQFSETTISLSLVKKESEVVL